MKYQGCLLVVKNAQKSKRFYQDFFGCIAEVDLEDYVIFKEGIMLQQEETWLGFIKKDKEELLYKNNVAELYFEDDNLDDFIQKLEYAKVNIMSPLVEQEWGQRSIRFYDLDNHIIEMGESMTFVIKRFLKTGMSVEEVAEKTMFPIEYIKECQNEVNK